MMKLAHLFAAATASYTANVTLGAAVAVRLIDTSGARWVHHAVYVITVVLTAAALLTAIVPGAGTRRKAAMLVPAALPLAVMPYASPRSWRHAAVALAAAPFFVAGVTVRGA